LTDIYGIGSGMESVLHRAGILAVADLWASHRQRPSRRVWGGSEWRVLFHQMLHGVDIQPQSSRFRTQFGSSNIVLEPGNCEQGRGARGITRHHLFELKAAGALTPQGLLLSASGTASPLDGRFGKLVKRGFVSGKPATNGVSCWTVSKKLWSGMPTYKPLSVGGDAARSCSCAASST